MTVDPLTVAMTEDELLTAVLGMARYQRWLCHHVRRSDRAITQGDSGAPDILMARPPRLLLVELKTERGKLSVLQEHWRDALVKCPGIEVYVWRPSSWRSGDIERVLA